MSDYSSKVLGLNITTGMPTTIISGDTVSTGGVWTFDEDLIVTGDLTVNGTTTTINTEIVTADRFLLQNAGYTTPSATTAGAVYNIAPISGVNMPVSISSFTAPATITVAADPQTALSAGAIIVVTGSNDPSNDGLYEVASLTATTIVIATGPAAALDGIVNDGVTTDGTAGGTAIQTTITVLRADSGGTMSIGSASDNTITFDTIGVGSGNGLQAAYSVTPTITTASSTDIAFTLSSGDFVVNGGGSVDFGDAGTNLTDFGIGTATFDLNATGAVDIDSTGGAISLDAAGASNFTTSSGDLTLAATTNSVTVQGAEADPAAVYLNASNAAGGIDVDAGTGGIDITTTGDMATTVSNTSATAWVLDSSGATALTLDTTDSQLEQGVFLDTGGEATGQGRTLANNTGGTLALGTLVGYDENTTIQIRAADATVSTPTNLTCRAVGVTMESISTASSGQVNLTHGIIVDVIFDVGVQTSDHGKLAFLGGTTAGRAVITAPSSAGDFVYEIGIIVGDNGNTAGQPAPVLFMPRFVAAIPT